MGLTFKSIDKGYVFWRDSITIPTKKRTKEGKVIYFRKEIPFEEAENYWEYIEEEYGYSMYYIKRGVSRRLARCSMPKYAPISIIMMLKDKVITADDCNKVEENKSRLGDKISTTSNWSIEWDDKPILLLVMQKPKMSYKEILDVITAEGGYVDSEGIIHKGTAENKVYVVR